MTCIRLLVAVLCIPQASHQLGLSRVRFKRKFAYAGQESLVESSRVQKLVRLRCALFVLEYLYCLAATSRFESSRFIAKLSLAVVELASLRTGTGSLCAILAVKAKKPRRRAEETPRMFGAFLVQMYRR
jgi:hypothetical protein